MMKKALPRFTEEESEKMEMHIFRIYDKNQNGVIDFHEFMTVFMILTGNEPEEILNRVFRIFDVDSDEVITQEEMLILVSDMHKLIKDDMKDNTDEDLAINAFLEMDTNNDGEVSRQEFVKAVANQKVFSQFLASKIYNMFG